jgi:hypothetical protein
MPLANGCFAYSQEESSATMDAVVRLLGPSNLPLGKEGFSDSLTLLLLVPKKVSTFSPCYHLSGATAR